MPTPFENAPSLFCSEIVNTKPLTKPSVQVLGKPLNYLRQILPAEPDPHMLISELKRT